jgi:3-deoxy-7-phosphoheptulonate synthase
VFVVMRTDASVDDVSIVLDAIAANGFEPHVSKGVERVVIGVKGPRDKLNPDTFSGLKGVLQVVRVTAPHKLASREWNEQDSQIAIGDVRIGAGPLTFIAGPCAVESRELMLDCARAVASGGAHMLRGGAFKPRTSPYDFQGLGEEGLRVLAEARELTRLPVVTEARSESHVAAIVEHCDMIQIGARNMQNFDLLKEAGRSRKPVLLKRGISAKISELLMSAEYVLAAGNENVVLCERGIRTFEDSTRNTLDVSAVPVLKGQTHLPVLIDPSHPAGKACYVAPLARAGVAAGADGILVEVHPDPTKALCDAAQALAPSAFAALVGELKAIRAAIAPPDRTPASPSEAKGANER